MFESVVEPSTPRLYVGNLSYDLAESDLFDFFSKVGTVKNVDIVRDRRTNRSKGYGFVEMADLEAAKQAFAQLNRSELVGRPIVVSGAKSERREGQRESSEPSR
ncbi:RNA-binding protein [Methylacidimicrobium sp. B4]|nr:RNA-binding protein [Methylacidimicrobium sp. B4]